MNYDEARTCIELDRSKLPLLKDWNGKGDLDPAIQEAFFPLTQGDPEILETLRQLVAHPVADVTVDVISPSSSQNHCLFWTDTDAIACLDTSCSRHLQIEIGPQRLASHFLAKALQVGPRPYPGTSHTVLVPDTLLTDMTGDFNQRTGAFKALLTTIKSVPDAVDKRAWDAWASSARRTPYQIWTITMDRKGKPNIILRGINSDAGVVLANAAPDGKLELEWICTSRWWAELISLQAGKLGVPRPVF